MLASFSFFFFALITHFPFFSANERWNMRKCAGARGAELNDLVTMRGPLCHTETETSRQLANLHKLTFITLASSVGRKGNGSGMPAAGYLTLRCSSVHKYSSTGSSTLTHTHSCTLIANGCCLPHNHRCSSKVRDTWCCTLHSSNGSRTVDQANKRRCALSLAALYLWVSPRPQSGRRG